MSLMAQYVDGKLQTSSTSSDSLSSKKKNSMVDSDTFLTLLVAEMQNQDPLEPTSNTEWVSQYATFAQVQQMSEMSDSMDLVRANGLIGKEVIMKVTSQKTGETNYKRGVVDYVVVEEGKPLLVIGEAKYSLDDLDTVASDEYFKAYDKYTEFVNKVAALPSLKVIDKSYESTIQELKDLYDGLSDYEKDYLNNFAAGAIESYKAYVAQLKTLGVTLKDKEEVKAATLDDMISAFDKKMSALMEQIAALKENSGSGSTPNPAPASSNHPDEKKEPENENPTSPAEGTDKGENTKPSDNIPEGEQQGTSEPQEPSDNSEDSGQKEDKESPQEEETTV